MLKKELLEERLASTDVFNPKSREINIPIQTIFPYGNLNINGILRDFYEGLTRAIFSGELRKRENENGIEPDLTDEGRRRYIEVKAAGHTRRIMLKDGQIDRYVSLQVSGAPIQNPRIYFSFWRYGVRGIRELLGDKNEGDVIKYLTQDTRFMVGLPFSVVHTIHSLGKAGHSLATRSYGYKGIPCTNFSTRAFDLFFSEPEEALLKFGFNLYDFRIRKTKLAEDISINLDSINPFPMVLIKDSDFHYKKFADSLVG